MKKIVVFILVSLFSFSCTNSCPKSHTLGLFRTPDYIKDFIRYDTVEEMTFISESGEIINFSKIDEDNLMVLSSLHRTVSCDENDVGTVDLFFEREVNRYRFVSNSGDTVSFLYYPIINTVIRDYSEVDIYDPQFYHRIMITLNDSFTRLDQARAAWENPEAVDFFAKPLNTPYEYHSISYEDVFYWEINDTKVVFYDDEIGLIGFLDGRGINWIRKK